MDKKITVHIDPYLKDLIPGYIKNRYDDIKRIKEALLTGDYETIRILAHSMKGSGGGYGFEFITELGKTMEQAAKEKDSDTIKKLVEELNEYLDRVEVVY